ncbi:MAG: hypothetical protein KatS3mg111_1522 [Pirellulaceae bacterium]|nr:MAG: hypothetical protein KatS3mg111_1522 [Pirellulaceae bacterium]
MRRYPGALALDSWAGALLLASTLLLGCGETDPLGERVEVEGVVTVDGAPLPRGSLILVPLGDTPGPKLTVPITDGNFRATGRYAPVAGEYRVEITAAPPEEFPMDDEEAFERLRAANQRRIAAIRIPPRYNTRSELTATVPPQGPVTWTFELSTKTRR